jgi:hypothetical protein
MKKIKRRELKTKLLEFLILHDGKYSVLEEAERLLELLSKYIEYEKENEKE